MDVLLFPAINDMELDGAVRRRAALSGSPPWASPTLKYTTHIVTGESGCAPIMRFCFH